MLIVQLENKHLTIIRVLHSNVRWKPPATSRQTDQALAPAALLRPPPPPRERVRSATRPVARRPSISGGAKIPRRPSNSRARWATLSSSDPHNPRRRVRRGRKGGAGWRRPIAVRRLRGRGRRRRQWFPGMPPNLFH